MNHDDPEVASNHDHDARDSERVRDLDPRPEPSPALAPHADGGRGSGPQGPMEPPLPGFPIGDEFLRELTVSASYQGPILADQIRQYDAVVPGIGKEIIEAQIINPQKRLDRVADAEIETAKRGQGWAIFLAVVFTVFAIVFAFRGNNVAAGIFMGPVFLAVLSLFLPGKK